MCGSNYRSITFKSVEVNETKCRGSHGAVAAAVLGAMAAWSSVGVAMAGDAEVVLESAINVDIEGRTVTLPLYGGRHDDETVYYIVVDGSDRDQAQELGINFAPKLENALGTPSVQRARVEDDGIAFEGTVDFSPECVFVAGLDGFPPSEAVPGSVGDAEYSPLITVDSRTVLNTPQVANASGVHDQVVSIDVEAGTVTLALVDGFYNGKEVLYLTTDSGDPAVSAPKGHTFAPNVNASPGIASNEEDSARSALVPVINGETGVDNPERQGLASAPFGEGDALNNLQEVPNNSSGSPRYSPFWDVHPLVWTAEAIANGDRERLTSISDIRNAVNREDAVSGGDGPRNRRLRGLRAAGFIVNCPMVVLL